MAIGIYAIRNIIDNKMYVGQSVKINYRCNRHRYELNKGIHANIHLQRAWSKYGQDSFEFEVLCECEPLQLDAMEAAHAAAVEGNLYNITSDFVSSRGENNPFYGKTHTIEAKQKMSAWKAEHYNGVSNPNFGKRASKEIRKKMVENNSRTKLNETLVLEITSLLEGNNLTHQEIADRYNISRTVITRIASGARWSNITGRG